MNTDSLQTYLGLIEAALISVATFIYGAVSDPAGFNWKSPVFWIGIVLAIVRGIKGYFAAGVKPEPVVK